MGCETFRFDVEWLLSLDILAFDRLLQKAREARNERLMEEANILRLSVNSGFSGDEKPFEALLDAYTPDSVKESGEQEKIEHNVRRLQRLFGG